MENQNLLDEKKINASQSGQSLSVKGQGIDKMSRSERQKKEK